MNARNLRCATIAVAALVAVPVVAAKLKQTISFAQPSNRTFGTAPSALSASASSGLPVKLESRTRAVCTVAGSAATPVTVGKCTIRASQGGNSTWAAAPNVERSFTIAKGVQTIAFDAPPSRIAGAPPFGLLATASSGLAVSFASLAPAVCAVAGTTVSLVAVGTCTVRATQAGNANYDPAPAVDRSFAVTPPQFALEFVHDAVGNVVGITRTAVNP